LFDAFSSRKPLSIPDQVRDRLSLENALLAAVLAAGSDAILMLDGGLKIRKQP
jgi:hypothetical protein